MKLSFAPLIVFLALAGMLLFYLLYGFEPGNIPSALVDKPAPRLSLPALEGVKNNVKGLSSASLTPETFQGKISLVNIWASWCVPCRQEHPVLMQLADDYPAIQIIGINQKDKPEHALRFLNDLGNPFDVIGRDEKGQASIEWGVYGVPESFIVSKQGIIVYKHIGAITPQDLQGEFGAALLQAFTHDGS